MTIKIVNIQLREENQNNTSQLLFKFWCLLAKVLKNRSVSMEIWYFNQQCLPLALFFAVHKLLGSSLLPQTELDFKHRQV